MKPSMILNRSRRHKGKGKKEQQSLLANASPPPSPSVWGVQDDGTGVLYPASSAGGFDSTNAVQLLSQPALSHLTTSTTTTNTIKYSSKTTVTRSSPVSVRSAPPANSALPAENRFVPQHEPRKGQSPENMISSAAVQFVPAYEESTTTPITTATITAATTAIATATAASPSKKGLRYSNNNSTSPIKRSSKAATKELLNHRPEPSDALDPPTWDAVIEADDSSLKSKSSKGSWRSRGSRRKRSSLHRRRDESMDSLSSTEEKKSSPSFRRRGRKHDSNNKSRPQTTTLNSSRGPPKVIMSDPSQEEASSVISGATSNNVTRSRGPRMARLASIFASRATVKSDERPKGPRSSTTKAAAKSGLAVKPAVIPASPARSQVSSGSSGYVGWPGTQDKRGKTVVTESSYDDSSVGAAAFHKKQYQDELENAGGHRQKPMEYELENKEEDDFDDTKSAADFHLAAVLATAVTTSISPKKKTLSPKQQLALRTEDKMKLREATHFSNQHSSATLNRYASKVTLTRRSSATHGDAASSIAATSVSGALSIHNLFATDPPEATSRAMATQLSYKSDPWDVDSSSQPPSSPGTSVSKDSSAFFHTGNASSEFPNLDPNFGVRTNVIGAASIIRRKKQRQEQEKPKLLQPQPPTEEALQAQNHLVPPPRSFNATAVRGYRGYLDKRTGVPNLMDDELDSDSMASSRAGTSIVSEQQQQQHHQSRLQVHVAKTSSLLKSRDIDEEDTSDVFDGLSNYGNSARAMAAPRPRIVAAPKTNGFQELHTPQPNPNRTADEEFNVVTLAGGLSLIQTTQEDFEKRKRPSDFDENLSSSEVDQYGFVKTPGFNEMMSAGRSTVDSAKYVAPYTSNKEEDEQGPPIRQIIPNNINKRRPAAGHQSAALESSTRFLPPREVTSSDEDSSQGKPHHAIRQVIRSPSTPTAKGVFDTTFSDSTSDGVSEIYDGQSVANFAYHRGGNLSQYRLHPNLSKKIVKAYRNLTRSAPTDYSIEEFQSFEDSKKAFALSEMRSRVMEKDLERGLERQGGSVSVDDIILTPYFQAAYRVRDAVIVSKAWRDGASPSDVVTAFRMTRRSERTHFVKRPMRMRSSPNTSRMSDSMSVASEYSYSGATRAYTLEAVTWMDDTDFMQMRCPSLGPRTMRGFEMFTIGDCQSILLKLTNERCIQLRYELNESTARQIDAEDMMKEEGDAGDGMMTESEMIYLTAMEDVKIISKQLVVAEKAFNLVRDRIEKLVARYEAMLIKIENESIATGSVVTYDESSDYSDEYDSEEYTSDEEEEDEREREMFQRRAQRAELRAELAAREAIMAKQAANRVRAEKQQEIDALQHKLAELQSESSFAITEREQSIVLAKAIAHKHGTNAQGSHHGRAAPVLQDDRINGVKQKFRERMAERMKARGGTQPGNFPATASTVSESGSSIQPYRSGRFNTSRPAPTAVMPHHRPVVSARSQRRQLVGEEMYQQLDFYERSLNAVDTTAM